MAMLRYLDPEGRICTKTLDTDQFLIGRANTCQIVFDDDLISREHVRIDVEADGRFRIRDLGSRNKTYVNGELVSETLLTAGDVLRAGDHVLEFVDDSGHPDIVALEFLTPDRVEPPHCEWVKTKTAVSLTMLQLEQLARIAGEPSSLARAEDIADTALWQILLDMQAERGFVALRGDEKHELRPIAHRALRRQANASLTPVSQWFALAPILQSVAGRYPQTAGQLNAKLGYASCAMAAPLTYRGDIIGVLYVDRPAPRKPFTSAALQYLAAAGAQLGALIGDSLNKLSRSATREGVAWLALLRRLQQSLSTPVAAGDGFDAASKMIPGRSRCGDFVDVVFLDEQRCALLLVDGGGHGVTGIVQANAIRMALRAALSAADETLLDPGGLFAGLSRMIALTQTRQVLPCTYVGIDLAAGKLVYLNAGGMAPLLMVAPGRLVTLDQSALVLGVDPDFAYVGTRADLPERFRLVLHSDGLVEAASVAGEALGDQRLHDALLHREAFTDAAVLAGRITQTFTGHLAGAQSDDDATILVVGRN